jgi:hypothetical protein
MDTDPMCRNDYLELVKTDHVLTACEKYSTEYTLIKQFLKKITLPGAATTY